MTDADNERDDVQQGQASNAADAADNARNQAEKSGSDASDAQPEVDVHGEPENPAG